MSFLVWKPRQVPGVTLIDEPEEVEDAFEVTLGVPRAADWPDDAFCRMSGSRKKDVALADCLFGAGTPVVSTRLKEALEKLGANNVEFLRVSIVNRKDRVVADDFYVVNPLDMCDCIDLKKSKPTWNSLDKTQISFVDKLVIDPSKVPPALKIFRLSNRHTTIIVRKEIADRFEALELMGNHFIEPLDFMG